MPNNARKLRWEAKRAAARAVAAVADASRVPASRVFDPGGGQPAIGGRHLARLGGRGACSLHLEGEHLARLGGRGAYVRAVCEEEVREQFGVLLETGTRNCLHQHMPFKSGFKSVFKFSLFRSSPIKRHQLNLKLTDIIVRVDV